MVVDELARRHDGSFRSKFAGQLAEVRDDERRLALLKPETYMNVSGRSVGAATRFFKVEPGVAARRPRRCRPRAGPAAGATRRRACRPQRPAFDRGRARDAGLPSAADRRRPSRSRRPPAGRRLRPVVLRAGGRRRRARRREPRTRSRRSPAKASSRPSSASTDPNSARSRHTGPRTLTSPRGWVGAWDGSLRGAVGLGGQGAGYD